MTPLIDLNSMVLAKSATDGSVTSWPHLIYFQ